MRFAHLFDTVVWERGKQYFERNRVANIQENEGVYTAEVMGEIPYKVKVVFSGNKVKRGNCSCPQAAMGNRCKHMAALLYAIEAERDAAFLESGKDTASTRRSAEKKEELPFGGKAEETGEYVYFDMAKMTVGLKFKENTCSEAKKLIRDGVVELERVEVGYNNRIQNEEQVGIAYGAVREKKHASQVVICFSRDGITQVRCETPGCYFSYYGEYGRGRELCVHATALLFLLADYIKEKNPGDATDRDALYLLHSFREKNFRNIQSEQVQEERNIQLEPQLSYDGQLLEASFRIGAERLYVVKNLTELVTAYGEGGWIQLGKSTELDFASSRFSDTSISCYEYVKKIVKEEQCRDVNARYSRHGYEAAGEDIKGRIMLYGSRIDEFFRLFQGKTISYADKRGRTTQKGMLLVQEGEPEVTLAIKSETDKDGVFHGVAVSGTMPQVIAGAEYCYYIEDDGFYRISREKAAALAPLIEMAYDGAFSFKIGRRNLSEFYYHVLPGLGQYAKVTEQEGGMIQKYLPPEAVFRFYLDAEEEDVTCRAEVLYGEQVFSLVDLHDRGNKRALYRDLYRENEVNYFVQQYFPDVDIKKDLYSCGGDEETVYQVMESGVEQLLALGEVHTTERFRHRNIRRKLKLSVGVSVESEIMNLTIASEDISREELLDILYSYRRKKRYYRLKNGDFLQADAEELENLSQMMEALHVTPKEFVKGKMQIPVYRALYLDKMLEQNENIYAERDHHFRQLVKDFKTVRDSEFEFPESLKKVMRGYQIHGYKWLRTLEQYGFGGILADDMGLGKTLQVISVLLEAKEEKKSGTSLVVTPASLVYNWKEEFARFAPSLKVNLIVGNQEERQEKLKAYGDWDVLVTSYDLLKRDIGAYEEIHFRYQIIDEAQYIKNYTTAAAKAVKIIKSRTRFALTGTPIENRLSELWSIFDYLMPGFLYGYETFRKELETPITKNKDEAAATRLKRMVSPFILRRLKGDVLKDLPEKIEEIRYARFEERQQRLYDGQVVHMKDVVMGQNEDTFQKNKMRVLAELTKIRQICCDPSLLVEDYQGGSAKREACVDLVKSAIEGEHRILLFSQFTSMLELLEKDFTREGIPFYKITGETPKEKRMELVRRFNEDSTPVFLISLKAGGTGLNLIGADVVIHYDPWWNLAVQNQATDRAHRIGQTKLVSVYKLIAKGTIEEKIVQMQETKKDFADAILSGENGSIVQMSREELLELLE